MILGGALVGVVADISSGQLGMAYIICFGIAAIIATTIVEPRGLSVTVLQQPLLFYVVTPMLGWISNRITSPGIDGFPQTRTLMSELLRMMYPLVSLFPWVLAIFITCVIIAVLRYLMVLKQDRQMAAARRRYIRRQERARHTTESATRARTAATERDRDRYRDRNQERERDRTNLRRQEMRRQEMSHSEKSAAAPIPEPAPAPTPAPEPRNVPRTERGEAVLGAGSPKADAPERHRSKGEQRRGRLRRSSEESRGSRSSATARTSGQRTSSQRTASPQQAATPRFDRAAIERERERRREAARRREVNRQIQPDVDRGYF